MIINWGDRGMVVWFTTTCKYYGSSCQMNKPQLVINNVDKEDAGIYKLEVISPTEAKSSSGILLQLHEGQLTEALI
jgi:hypothetical protein